jgi:hypothetical protein
LPVHTRSLKLCCIITLLLLLHDPNATIYSPHITSRSLLLVLLVLLVLVLVLLLLLLLILLILLMLLLLVLVLVLVLVLLLLLLLLLPQGLLAGRDDIEAMRAGGIRDINRHFFSLQEAQCCLQRPVVKVRHAKQYNANTCLGLKPGPSTSQQAIT